MVLVEGIGTRGFRIFQGFILPRGFLFGLIQNSTRILLDLGLIGVPESGFASL